MSGCVPEDGGSNTLDDGVTSLGEDTGEGDEPGDGDPNGDGDDDGDGDPGDDDGDGDPSDGDPNGDGDPGDGDPNGDGDPGDGDPNGDGDPGDDGDDDGDGDDGDENGDENGDCIGGTPYAGGWDIGCCQDDIVPGAWSPGQVSAGAVLPDWIFSDQYGDAVRVYDFCHEAIYFEYAAMWCVACMAHAPEVASLFDTYDAQGLITLTYMSQDAEGAPPSQADVDAWAQQFSQDGIVAFSDFSNVWYPFGVDQGGGSYSISLPGTMLVAPGVEVVKVGVPSLAELEAALP
ncbi:hypothetical protein ENSA5_06130 [Enhygromyxa salina]|uniref:Thioredoxin domain-containing protein n=1 Tax=Enhygromyxa salina TaxID=215803 RepID=A0A2S9YHM1_9BACT|nr:hypothetical protein [Enhygromyxa salina]PRQ04608.1 hypothetical protein ENSA5_06130 [Enhygromyxa salina]